MSGDSDGERVAKQAENEVAFSEVKQAVDALPPGLANIYLDFAHRLARTLIAQETSVGSQHGDATRVESTPADNDFYSKRFDEILGSGLVNPHMYPKREIK